jgi:hypothetical protein
MFRYRDWQNHQRGQRCHRALLAGAALLVFASTARPAPADEPRPADAGDLFDEPTTAAVVDPEGQPVAKDETANLNQRLQVRSAEVMREKSFLAQGTAGVDPFISNDASAVIGRPSMSQLFDTAVDFNNQEATFGLKVAPALLVTPWPDWYITGLSLIGSANTDQTSFAFGGKWDINFRDPRFAYGFYHEEVEAEYRTLATQECGAAIEGAVTPEKRAEFLRCRGGVMSGVVSRYHARLKENPFAFSVGGNAAYDNDGKFGGSNAILALNATQHLLSGFNFVLTANGKYEDRLPSDAEFDELKKQTMMPQLVNDERDQKIGGGIEMALKHGLGGENGNERSIELGFGAAALACLGGACDRLSDGSTLQLNPFLALALTKTLGGRIDVFWDGTGNTLGDAIAGVSFKYAFRGLDAPFSRSDERAAPAPPAPE